MNPALILQIGLAVVRALPPMENWISAVFLKYKDWRLKYDEAELQKKITEAVQTDSTSDLNETIGKL